MNTVFAIFFHFIQKKVTFWGVYDLFFVILGP